MIAHHTVKAHRERSLLGPFPCSFFGFSTVNGHLHEPRRSFDAASRDRRFHQVFRAGQVCGWL